MWFLNQYWWTYSSLRLILSSVCYHRDEVGCFYKKEPFKHFDYLPNAPGVPGMGVKFELYTRRNTNSSQEMNSVMHRPESRSSLFNTEKITTIIIHGFNDNGNSSWVRKMKDGLLEKEDHNVIVVNWEKGAKHLNYLVAASNTRTVGAYLGLFLIRLGIDLSKVHLIGHSLGAHIAGFAGAWTKGMIGRISGLDPAGPMFDKYLNAAKLDANDAIFVDVIHTDAGGKFNLGLGGKRRCGDVDFFPNGGEIQPGCNKSAIAIAKSILHLQIEGLYRSMPCSHERVIELYTESITSDCKFLACECSKKMFLNGTCINNVCTEMGYHVDRTVAGEFYGRTNAVAPYCISLDNTSEQQKKHMYNVSKSMPSTTKKYAITKLTLRPSETHDGTSKSTSSTPNTGVTNTIQTTPKHDVRSIPVQTSDMTDIETNTTQKHDVKSIPVQTLDMTDIETKTTQKHDVRSIPVQTPDMTDIETKTTQKHDVRSIPVQTVQTPDVTVIETQTT